MPKGNFVVHSFNRGIVSAKALGRTDLEKMKDAAETQVNFMPGTTGNMMFRPGTEYVTSTYSDAKARNIPFVYSFSDVALIELSGSLMRVLVNETPITRASVSTTVTNGDFSAGAGWTVTSTGTATGTISGGMLTVACPDKGGVVTVDRAVTVAVPDRNVEHAFRIVVTRGPIYFQCGTTAGDDDVLTRTKLYTGIHSLAFTPTTGTVYPQFESTEIPERIVDSITIEAAGVMTLATPWPEADLRYVRYDQSGDVLFMTCRSVYKPKRIERRATNSWSIVDYKVDDGPFIATASADLKLWVDGSIGNVTLNASRDFFKSTHVGALFRVFTSGYNLAQGLCVEDQSTDAIRVNGVGTDRFIYITLTGTWVGTMVLERSFDSETTGFVEVDGITYTTNTTNTRFYDGFSNSICWYRMRWKTRTSGSVTAKIDYEGSGTTGICRVVSYTSATSVEVEVLKWFSSTNKSEYWLEGDWSDKRGYPTAVSFHDGRLWWAGRDRIWASVSDAFESFDQDVDGDSAPISRSIGYGPVAFINYLLPMQRLIVGSEMSEISVRSSSFDEPLTPTNFTLKDCSTQGSARVGAVKIDSRGVFVQKSKRRLYELSYSIDTNDYRSRDLNLMAPDLNDGVELIHIGVQRQPDTRIHCVRDDGDVVVLTYEPEQEVVAWAKVELADDGIVEDVCVLPGDGEDKVYYIVRRTVNGSTKRYLERFALQTDCVGGTLSRNIDCHKTFSAASTTTITGASHLEGKTVYVWANGKSLGSYTVTGGQITGLSEAVTSAVYGLGYTARWKSTKLAYAAAMGTALAQRKRLIQIALLLHKTHYQGVKYGPDFDNLDDLPLIEDWTETAADTIHENYDADMFEVNGTWDTDSRLCLQSTSPYPANIMAAIIAVQTNDKA